MIGDKNAVDGQKVAADLGKDVSFVECDVSKYEDLVKLFAAAKETFGRVDLGMFLLFELRIVAANAGVAETLDIFESLDRQSVPTKPVLTTIDVDLYGVVYTAYLAIHSFLTNDPPTGGRFVVTSSAAGLYGMANLPTYCAAKFGCVGFVRSLGLDKRMMNHGITFNAICPAVVQTGIAPPVIYDYIKTNMPQVMTPMSTIMTAFNMILDSNNNMTGEVLECIGEQVAPCRQQTHLGDLWDRFGAVMERFPVNESEA